MAKDDSSESSAEKLSEQEDMTDHSADENLPDEDEEHLKDAISSVQGLHVAGEQQSKISRKRGLASLSSVPYNLCDLGNASSEKLPRNKRKYFPGHDLDDDEDDGDGKEVKIPSSKKMKLSVTTTSSDSIATDDHVGSITPPAALLSASANQDSDHIDDDGDGNGKEIKIRSSKKMKLSTSASSLSSVATDELVGSTIPPPAASANEDSDQVHHHQGTDQVLNQESPSQDSFLSSESKESKPSSDDEESKPSSD